MSGDETDPDEILRQFREAVNMSASELREWLGTPHSREVGWTREGEGESVGHHAGRDILALLDRPKGAVSSEDDLARMRRVIGYVHRHLAQGPAEDVEHSRWRYSLMNWGHDPVRDGRGRGEAGKAPEGPAGETKADALARRLAKHTTAGAQLPARSAAATLKPAVAKAKTAGRGTKATGAAKCPAEGRRAPARGAATGVTAGRGRPNAPSINAPAAGSDASAREKGRAARSASAKPEAVSRETPTAGKVAAGKSGKVKVGAGATRREPAATTGAGKKKPPAAGPAAGTGSSSKPAGAARPATRRTPSERAPTARRPLRR